jgi:SAM-dependent methyltransferase
LSILARIQRALKNPRKVYKIGGYKLKHAREMLLWHYRYFTLRKPKVKSALDPGRSWMPHATARKEMIHKLKDNGFEVLDYHINTADYTLYMNKAEYLNFPNYFDGGRANYFVEKSLEHFLAARLLNLSKDDIYLDVASSNSPAAEIYHKLYRCKTFRQDLTFAVGINGNMIGGDAASLPVEDCFATKMGLHCSFEHFEGDSDIKFIKEASRVLRKGGKLCILPLYLFKTYAIQTDPAVIPKNGIAFEKEAVLYCKKGWGNRHGRFYDIPHFIARIKNNLNDLKLTIYVVQNEKEVDPSCYVKFIGLFEKE